MVMSGILGLSYLKFKPVVFWGDYLLKIILGIAITAFIFEGISKLKVGNKANSFLGGISYEVYILHRSVFVLIGFLFATIQSGVFIITSILATIMLAIGLKVACKPIIRKITSGGK